MSKVHMISQRQSQHAQKLLGLPQASSLVLFFYISIFFLLVCFLQFSLHDLKSHLEEFLPNLLLLTRWMPAPLPRIFKTSVHILIFYQDKTGPLSFTLLSTSAYFPQTSHYEWKFINVTFKYTILFEDNVENDSNSPRLGLRDPQGRIKMIYLSTHGFMKPIFCTFIMITN